MFGQAVSRKPVIFETIAFTNNVSRETACVRDSSAIFKLFPSEAQLIDFQAIQQVEQFALKQVGG
ncbi:MAG: hypothetical protein VYC24_05635, partial [Acidobacteriota bacterium]|nr:hypothetical protein [Acidobacteriota bacterium]